MSLTFSNEFEPSRFDPSPAEDQQALLAMFRRIPIGMLEATATRLLNATKTTRTSRSMKEGEDGVMRPDTIQEPDYYTQYRTFELIVTQRVGRPMAREPEKAPPEKDEVSFGGRLKPLKVKKAREA